MKLVDNAQEAWKWHSTQVLAALAALPVVWETMPAELKQNLPEDLLIWVTVGVALGGIIGRVRQQ